MPLLELLAGPILRRVEKRQVSVWLAFSENFHVTLKIWEGSDIKHANAVGNQPPGALATGEAPSLQIGARLFVALVTATVDVPGLNPAKVYSYNILLRSAGAPEPDHDLRSLKMLENGTVEDRKQLALGYKKDILPTFILPADSAEKLIIAQGSCRKMHGDGDDALAYLDKVIEDNLVPPVDETKPFLRPQQLFLTGDQIYADDVPGALLKYAGNTGGVELVGHETVQIRKNNSGPVKTVGADIVNFPIFLRQHVLNEYAGFTSTSASCHLIAFEEFCAVYLNYWNIRAWNDEFIGKLKKIKPDADQPENAEELKKAATSLLDSDDPDDDPTILSVILDENHIRKTTEFIFDEELEKIFDPEHPNNKKKWLAEKRQKLINELRNIVKFYEALPKVSRVLANIPSYMMFDDHEITDDWYITKRWRNQVFSKPLGRDIIRNGLMAYAIFQDWGNVPLEYTPAEGADTPRKRLQALISEYGTHIANHPIPTPGDLSSLRTDILDPLENLFGMGAASGDIKWHYNVPSGPAVTYVLDTRTRREYASLNAAPGLVPEAALREQTPDSLSGTPPFSIIISPVPVLGLSSFEELIQPGASAAIGLKSKGDNPGIIGGLLEFDYEAWGFNTAAFERLLERLNILQKVIILSGDVHYGFSSMLDYWKGTSATPTARIIQLTSSALKNMWFANVHILRSGMVQRILTGFNGKLEKVGWKDKVLTTNGFVSGRNRARLRRKTAVVPVEGWNPGSTVNLPPDFRWRLRISSDERPEFESPAFTEINLVNNDVTKEIYKQITTRHQEAFKSGLTRRVIWPSNLSLIRFEGVGDDMKVRHEFMYKNESDNKIKAHTQHVIPLKAAGNENTAPALP